VSKIILVETIQAPCYCFTFRISRHSILLQFFKSTAPNGFALSALPVGPCRSCRCAEGAPVVRKPDQTPMAAEF
jgi:hypothetical protein